MFIPTRSEHRRHGRTRPWMSSSLARLRNRRRAAARRFKLCGSAEANREFENLNREFNTQNEREYKAYVKDQGVKIRRDPKRFWKFVDEKRKCSSFPAEMSYGLRTARGGQEISNLFAEHFKSTFSSNDTFSTEALDFSAPSVATDESNLCLPFSEEDVNHVMRNLDTSKGAGPDGFPPSFWKHTASALATPLTLILNNSLSQGVFPSEWKRAFVVAIHKSGFR